MNTILMAIVKTLIVAFSFLFTACAAVNPSTQVLSGEIVKLSYSCRSEGGELLATTSSIPDIKPQQSKTPLLIASTEPQAVTLQAGPEKKCSTCPKDAQELVGFNAALSASLADTIVGLTYGVHKEIHIAREVPEGLPRGKRYLGMAKVWRRPKLSAMLVDDYREMMGRDPMVGYTYDSEMGLRATVSKIEKGHVTIQYAPAVALGSQVPTHFGEGIIQDDGTKWKIDIQVHEGQLIHSGELLGRVVEVNPTMFYIDFGHPFGHLELVCDLKIEPYNQ